MSLELCLALAECEYWTWQSLLWSCAERQQQKQNKKRNMKLLFFSLQTAMRLLSFLSTMCLASFLEHLAMPGEQA